MMTKLKRRSRRRTMDNMCSRQRIASVTTVIFAAIVCIGNQCNAFCPTGTYIDNTHAPSHRPSSSPHSELHSSKIFASPLGDLFSGITGQAPKSLQYPPDVLTNTNIDPERPNVDIECVYKASRDGWSAVDFHQCVDGRGSGLVLVLGKNGKRFGGYNPLGWMSTDDYGSSNSAFLWFEQGGKAVRCPVLSGGNAALFDYATGGPNFGASDLCIGSPQAAVLGGFAGPDTEDITASAGNLRQGSSSAGGAYDVPRGWPARGKFGIVEVEVYCNGNIQPSGGGGGGGFSLWPF